MSGSRGGFSVTISAVDQASKQIDAVNARIRAMQAPAERVQKSMGRLADTTGITALGNGMRSLARESLQAFENIGRIGGPLGAITGVASLAGLARMTTEFANMGSQLGFSSQRTGVAVDQLHALQGASKLAGSSAESLSSGMKTLKDNIFEISAGRAAPTTIAAFNQLGITLRDKVTGQLRGAADVLPELADKIAAIKDPTMQATFATMTLGGAGEDLLPFLRRGAAGIAEYTAKARQYGVVNQVGADAANTLRERQAELGLATEGLGLAISEKLAPVLGPMLTDLAKWVSDNRGIIGTDVAGWVGATVPAIKGFATDVDGVAKALGGWKVVIEGIVALTFAGWALRVVAALNPLTLALAGILLTFEKIANFEEKSSAKNLPVGSPLWQGMPEEEQSNYVNSPRSQAFLHPNGGNPNDFSWFNPGSWFGRGQNQQPGTLPGGGKIVPSPGAASEERGIRNRNPLNLSYVPGQAGVLGRESGSNHQFGVFPDMATGIAAETMQLINYQDRGLKTVRQLVNKWVSDPAFDSTSYVNDVARAVNANPDAPINMRDPKVARAYISAAAKHESGAVSDVDVQRGVDLALAPHANIQGQAVAPPANIQGGSGTAAPAAATTTTVKGSADLRVKIEGPPGMPTRTSATTSGDLFNGAPKIETAMAGVGP